MLTISSVTSPEPDIVTFDENSNDPTLPYGFGAERPILPPIKNDLNPFNTFGAMTVVQQNPTQLDNIFSPQSPEPSEPSPISTPLMNLRTIDGWETPHTTTQDKTFYSED